MSIYDKWLEHFTPLGVIDDLKSSHHAVVSDDENHDGKTLEVKHLNPYHHENVWDHVHMVRDEALAFSDPIVETLALLHDVAKPFMRYYNAEKNRVRFSGHEFGSALMSVNYLKEHHPDLVLPLLKVITFHIMGLRGDNIYEWEDDPQVIHYLKLLNRVDSLGRIAEDTKDRAGAIKRVEDAVKNWVPIDDTEFWTDSDKTYTVIIGIPGSGKSTYLKDYDGVVFNHDDYMEKLAEEKFGIVGNYNEAFKALTESKTDWVPRNIEASLQALKTNDRVCLDATNLTKKKRVSISNRARKAGAKVEYVMFWRDWFDCWDCRSKGDKTIPLGVYKRMIGSFTYPKREEYDCLKHIVI